MRAVTAEMLTFPLVARGVAQAVSITLVGRKLSGPNSQQDSPPFPPPAPREMTAWEGCIKIKSNKKLSVSPQLEALAEERNAGTFCRVTLTSVGPGITGQQTVSPSG